MAVMQPFTPKAKPKWSNVYMKNVYRISDNECIVKCIGLSRRQGHEPHQRIQRKYNVELRALKALVLRVKWLHVVNFLNLLKPLALPLILVPQHKLLKFLAFHRLTEDWWITNIKEVFRARIVTVQTLEYFNVVFAWRQLTHSCG